MARYKGPAAKQSRAAGVNLEGSPKVAKVMAKRPNQRPGQHGAARKKTSEFGIQLLEKQKVKRTYGLLEKQFYRNYLAAVQKKGVTGTQMLQRLEQRLDNLVFRSGLARTRRQARQLVAHGHMLVDGKKVDIASYLVKPGQVIAVCEKSQAKVKALGEGYEAFVPHWLDVNTAKQEFILKNLPEREDMDQTIKEALIIESYSR